jgi:hypothetical protein
MRIVFDGVYQVGTSPIHLAATGGHTDLLLRLLEIQDDQVNITDKVMKAQVTKFAQWR